MIENETVQESINRNTRYHAAQMAKDAFDKWVENGADTGLFGEPWTSFRTRSEHTVRRIVRESQISIEQQELTIAVVAETLDAQYAKHKPPVRSWFQFITLWISIECG